MHYKYADELKRGDVFANGERIDSPVTPDPFENGVWCAYVKRENSPFGHMVWFYEDRRYAIMADARV